MFIDITWQDYLASSDRAALLLEAIRRYKASSQFNQALEANCYFRGENSAVSRKTILRARKMEGRDASGRRRVRTGTEDVVGNRIASAFLYRFVTQQNQFLLSEGVSLPPRVQVCPECRLRPSAGTSGRGSAAPRMRLGFLERRSHRGYRGGEKCICRLLPAAG